LQHVGKGHHIGASATERETSYNVFAEKFRKGGLGIVSEAIVAIGKCMTSIRAL
jgi:hypothetical protein